MAVTKVVMPKLSEQMETGKIIKWLKNEGDRIQSGDILAEVETDKADVEMEAFGSGVLRKILVPAGNKAPVGALIGVIAEPNDDIAPVVSQAGGGAGAAPAAAAPAKPSATPGPETAPRAPQPAQRAGRPRGTARRRGRGDFRWRRVAAAGRAERARRGVRGQAAHADPGAHRQADAAQQGPGAALLRVVGGRDGPRVGAARGAQRARGPAEDLRQ